MSGLKQQMSLKQLEQAIKNRPKPYSHPRLKKGFYVDRKVTEWFEDFVKKFAEFKERVVCIPRKQLEERKDNLESILETSKIDAIYDFRRGIIHLAKELLEESK